ncbi:hypothetical protein Droror1_Dr00027304 [Drosera rotundifolia]
MRRDPLPNGESWLRPDVKREPLPGGESYPLSGARRGPLPGGECWKQPGARRKPLPGEGRAGCPAACVAGEEKTMKKLWSA